jgi:hypothetical protein
MDPDWLQNTFTEPLSSVAEDQTRHTENLQDTPMAEIPVTQFELPMDLQQFQPSFSEPFPDSQDNLTIDANFFQSTSAEISLPADPGLLMDIDDAQNLLAEHILSIPDIPSISDCYFQDTSVGSLSNISDAAMFSQTELHVDFDTETNNSILDMTGLEELENLRDVPTEGVTASITDNLSLPDQVFSALLNLNKA